MTRQLANRRGDRAKGIEMREKLAIGVISGTSADGIDAAALITDGVHVSRTLGGVTVPYAEDLRAEVLSLMAAPERCATPT